MVQQQSSGAVPPDELAELLSETNFTDREIRTFYQNKRGDSDEISKTDFCLLCLEQNIKNPVIIERMWKVFDRNHDGHLTYFELVLSLNPLLRGTPQAVAELFLTCTTSTEMGS